MAFYWTGGRYGTTLPYGVYTLRFNELSEIPIGNYDSNGQTLLRTDNVYQTRYKHRTNSIVAYINGVKVDVAEITGRVGIPNYHFIIPSDAGNGYLRIEYLPYDEGQYYSDTPMTVSFPTVCNNKTTQLNLVKITSILNAINTIEAHMANSENAYLYTDKIQFVREQTRIIPEMTKEEIQQYQESIKSLRTILDRTTGIETPINITSISTDNSYLLQDRYLSELRAAILALDTQYGISE